MIIPMFVGWIPLNAILTRAPIWFHPRSTVSGQVLEAGGVRALDIGAGTGLFGTQWVFELQRGSIIKKYKDIIHKLCLVDDCYIWLYHFMGIWFHIIYIYIHTYKYTYIYIYYEQICFCVHSTGGWARQVRGMSRGFSTEKGISICPRKRSIC